MANLLFVGPVSVNGRVAALEGEDLTAEAAKHAEERKRRHFVFLCALRVLCGWMLAFGA
jgi:hypothetical protein